MYSTSGIRLKIFVKEQNKNGSLQTQTDPNVHKYFNVAPLTGDKAKQFYEDVINEPSTAIKNPVVKAGVTTRKKSQSKIFKESDLLSWAQNNDVKNLENFLSQKQDYDINIADEYGWTPLMCACCSGAEDAVDILLRSGADVLRKDRLGNTALKLAKTKNHKRIVKMLEDFEKTKLDNEKVEEEVVELPDPFFCNACNETFKMKKDKHESSTLHLFNSRLKTPTFYGIPESNKGFQILLREGWDKERGLGPDGTGRKFPIKAVMKKDRKGIGADDGKSNVKAVYHTEKYESRQKKIYNKRKEKEFERNFRLEFS